MAESSARFDEIKPEQGGGRQRLRYLDFVAVAAAYALTCLSGMYEFAKENAGPLRPGVQSVEGTVKAVVGPVVDRFHDVPLELLKFVDRKLDDVVKEAERHVPSVVKQAPCVARSIAADVQNSGVLATASNITRSVVKSCEPTAKELYEKYEPVAEKYTVSAWRSLNRLPLFPQVAQIAVPTAAHWSDKYNRIVVHAAEQGYTVAAYLPLVPIDRIAKVFGDEPSSPVKNGTANPEAESAADNNN